jgi:beta-glucanase (GH16 family)
MKAWKTRIQLCSAAVAVAVILGSTACGRKKEIAGSTGGSGEYRLVWSDEFDRDGEPDSANWNFERGFVRNQEAQWYQPANARCENGTLVIEARRERVTNPDYAAGSGDWTRNREYAEYTSSSLLTRGLRAWRYGRFEMRARIDTRPGLWPAFWTLGETGDWPHCGEIDIMEYYRGMVLANFAWGAEQKWQAVWDSFSKPVAEFGDPDWSRKFHVWRMDWTETDIRLFLDDAFMNAVGLSTTVNRDAAARNPFLQRHYLIVNLAVGGTAGGDPSNTVFPARVEIDYVRVYQK